MALSTRVDWAVGYRHLPVCMRYRFFQSHPLHQRGLCSVRSDDGRSGSGLATTEMVTVVENEVSGYVDTDVGKLGR